MPKMKTKQAAAKRFKVLASGKVKKNRSGKQHILTKKGRGRKNKLKKANYVQKTEMRHILRCLPTGTT